MGRYIRSDEYFEYKYASWQCNNLVWLPRKAKVGRAHFCLRLAISYKDGSENEDRDFANILRALCPLW